MLGSTSYLQPNAQHNEQRIDEMFSHRSKSLISLTNQHRCIRAFISIMDGMR